MMRGIQILLLILLSTPILPSVGYTQTSEKYNSIHKRFFDAEDLYEKEKYSAAQEEFKLYISENTDRNHPYYIKAKFYIAVSSLYLYHPDAEELLLQFLNEYPESIYRPRIYMELGRYYYRKKNWGKVIYWFNEVDMYDLDEKDKAEYYFKRGYAYFHEDLPKEARNDFYEVIQMDSQYKDPALYYYSHIAFQEENYQTALEGFLQLTEAPAFKNSVPYYITHIYYSQGRMDEVIKFTPGALENEEVKHRIEMSYLLGDAYYQRGDYANAIPHLLYHNTKSETSRDDEYQLGYCYYKTENYPLAVRHFDRVAKIEDELGQIALYHIAQSYLAEENYLYARNAFKLASDMSFDADIEEDALYQFAVLSYKLDYDPFNDAMIAFELYLDRYPNSHRSQDVYQYLINVYTTMGNYYAALNSLEKIENKDFELKTAYQLMAYNYGVQLYSNQNMTHAIDAFKKVKTYPMSPKLNALGIYYTAEAQFFLADYSTAIVTYRKFLAEPGGYLLPEHNDAYYNIGYAYYRQDDYESAAQNFRTYTQDPNETDNNKLSDALLRIGDCYFVKENPDDDKAISYYQKAIDTKHGQVDYAKYQIGIIYGFKKDYQKKADYMMDVVKNHKNSAYVVLALYETGEAYRLMDNEHTDKALEYYNRLIVEFPGHPKGIDAIFQIGVLHFRSKNYTLAEKQFLRILNEYDDPVKDKEALALLEDVYTALNQPEKYLALLESEGLEFDQVYEDSLLYEAGFRLFEDSLYLDAVNAFDNYLGKFTKPIRETEALYYLGTSHLRTDNDSKALNAYERLLELPTSVYSEFAALFASQKAYEVQDYDKSIKYYRILESTATYPENKLNAQIGLMRSYTFQENFGSAQMYAQKVLASDLALDNVKTEANYVLGKANFEAGNIEEAMPYFVYVSANSSGKIGAESQYHVALIYHLQEDYSTSETEVRNLMKDKAGYDYWVAKALLLQVKNSIGVEDYVQAEYTLNSVLNGYTNQDDGIIDEALEIQKVLEELKNPDKEIEDEGDDTIEIGNDE